MVHLKLAIVALVPAGAVCLVDSQSLHLCQSQIRGKDAADVLSS